jgi:biopolymer transport protein ExbD
MIVNRAEPLKMKPLDPNKKSKELRRFKPTRKPAGVFSIAIAFCDSSLLALAFFLAASPFVLQPGINITLPKASFSGGARFGSMVLSITRGGWFYFNDERLNLTRLPGALQAAVEEQPGFPLIIEADESVPHGVIVKAWDAARAAGVNDVSMATRIAGGVEDVR